MYFCTYAVSLCVLLFHLPLSIPNLQLCACVCEKQLINVMSEIISREVPCLGNKGRQFKSNNMEKKVNLSLSLP